MSMFDTEQARAAAKQASEREAPAPGRRAPANEFASGHEKVMRNYTYASGTKITNLLDNDLEWEPNDYKVESVKAEGERRKKDDKRNAGAIDKQTKRVLQTISVDIGTVVGGKAPDYREGHVFVFHKTHVKGPDDKIQSGDHTGWVQVKRLGGSAAKDIKQEQARVEARLAKGETAGAKTKVKGDAHTFSVQGADVIVDGPFDFQIAGTSKDKKKSEGGTDLGNYTHRPKSYGDVIVGTWNPPGSGGANGPSAGSGGVRAFLPIATTKFYLTDEKLEIKDQTGKGTATWRYVRTKVNGDTIFCWVLQKWTTPKGNGHNFR